jgi:hypothetical protein
MHAPPPTGTAEKAPPGSPGVGEGAGVTVTLDEDAFVVGPLSAPYPIAKASTAAAPHTAIAVVPLW